MDIAERSQRFGRHDNAFGLLRLLFASLVIVSHVPELVDGNRDRELLTMVFGTLSFGDFAVNGFFVISGFLITASLVSSTSVASYLIKRIGRIYPAFIAASLFSLLIVAPLSGAYLTRSVPHTAAMALFRMAILSRPMMAGAFPEHGYTDPGAGLNGAMWTIQYEFACYLLAVALVALGVLRRPAVLPVLAVLLLGFPAPLADRLLAWLPHPMLFPGAPSSVLRLSGMFVAGASFWAFQQRLRFDTWMLAVAALGLAATLFSSWTANLGFAIFGGYLIFAVAHLAGGTRIGAINNKTDISYGVYLYAGPVEHLLARQTGDQLVLLGVLTWVIAMILGWLSWRYLEKPALRLTRRLAAIEFGRATSAKTIGARLGIGHTMR